MILHLLCTRDRRSVEQLKLGALPLFFCPSDGRLHGIGEDATRWLTEGSLRDVTFSCAEDAVAAVIAEQTLRPLASQPTVRFRGDGLGLAYSDCGRYQAAYVPCTSDTRPGWEVGAADGTGKVSWHSTLAIAGYHVAER